MKHTHILGRGIKCSHPVSFVDEFAVIDFTEAISNALQTAVGALEESADLSDVIVQVGRWR